MKLNKKYIILFAGVVGCSKTPIANYLSTKLNLPVFNNDAIRTEVIEDLGRLDEKEHLKRRDNRLKETLEQNKSFILDASIDRVWKELQEKTKKFNYEPFIISLDLSKPFLKKLYRIKGYTESLERLDELISNHNNFLKEYKNQINLHITEKDFPKRLTKSYTALKNCLK